MQLLITLVAIAALAQAPAPSKADQLQEAARKGDAATVTHLLDEGVDVNTKFRYGTTALFFACDHGHVDVVKVLLDRGADLTVKDSFYGFTPLMLAVEPAQKRKPGHTEIAKLLIAKGAPGKEEALSAAAGQGDAVLAKFILDTGGLPASNLSEVLEVAKAGNKTEIVRLLEQAGAKPLEDFKIDTAQLERFAGTYKNASGNEITVAVAGFRLTVGVAGTPPTQRTVFAAINATTFRGIGTGGVRIVFKVDGDRVTGFNRMPPEDNPIVYTRVEGK
jgi:ankyrin repeat protein